jgi:hypothetical protein
MRFPNSNQPQVGSLAGIGSLGFGGVGTNTQAAPYMMGQPMGGVGIPAPAPVYSPGVAPAAPVNNLLAPSIQSFSDPMSAALGTAMGADSAGYGSLVDVSPGAAPTDVAGVGGMGDMFKSTFLNKDGGLNVGNITGLLSSIAGIYGGFQQLGLAKDSLALSKETFKVNTENQKKSYNTALEDRASGRYSDTNPDRGKADDYLKRNRL